MEINNSFLVGLGEWGNSYNAASTPPVYSECAISVVSPCLPYFHHGSKKGRWGWRIRQVWDQFSSVAQSCPTFCDPMDCSMRGFPVHHQLLELAQFQVNPVGDVIQPSHPLSSPLLQPSLFPRINVFSKEWVLCIRWPKYWSFSFNISPSNEYSRLIFFRIDWFDLLAAQGTFKSPPAPQFKSINSSVLSLLNGPTLRSAHDYMDHSLV